MQWHDKEEQYLQELHDMCIQLSKQYMLLYKKTHAVQTKLRLPSIIMSSFSGVASFGSTSFPPNSQKYVSIVVGIINVGIAMIQTYESYLKIGDIVAKSLSCSNAFKKLADDIYCEIFIPVEDRDSNGITFLRDCFSRYQAIIDQCPPIEETETSVTTKGVAKRISNVIRRLDTAEDVQRAERVVFGRITTTASDSARETALMKEQSKYALDKVIVHDEPRNI